MSNILTLTIHTIYNKCFEIKLSNDSSIGYLKSIIQDNIGVHPDCIYLYYNNIFLNDDKMLCDYNISTGDNIIQYDRKNKN